MSDKTLQCKDCQAEFIFSEGEQEFYKEKGFDQEPVRCPDCRKARKDQKGGSGFGNRNKSSGNRW